MVPNPRAIQGIRRHVKCTEIYPFQIHVANETSLNISHWLCQTHKLHIQLLSIKRSNQRKQNKRILKIMKHKSP